MAAPLTHGATTAGAAGHAVTRSRGHAVTRSRGHTVTRSRGHAVTGCSLARKCRRIGDCSTMR
ncbi:hypothetical protein CVT30_40400 [Streptomyces sp. AMCC400023]|nr:hypothetical protein CVT30_40400 [Streptomyces sp. AMCC400023]